MRTITFLAALTAMLLSSSAKASELYLRINGQGQNTLSLGTFYYYSNTGEFIINELYPGTFHIRVTQTVYQRNNRGRGRNPGRGRGRGQGRGHGHGQGNQNHNTYERVIYQGPIYIPPQSRVFARLTPSGHLIIERTVPLRRNPAPRRGPRYGSRGSSYPNYGTGTNAGLSRILEMIERESFESNKLNLAKQYVRTNEVSSEDIYFLMKAMDFESSRLNLAKFAYDYVFDPENYFIVNQAFDFDSSKAALEKYIR